MKIGSLVFDIYRTPQQEPRIGIIIDSISIRGETEYYKIPYRDHSYLVEWLGEDNRSGWREASTLKEI